MAQHATRLVDMCLHNICVICECVCVVRRHSTCAQMQYTPFGDERWNCSTRRVFGAKCGFCKRFTFTQKLNMALVYVSATCIYIGSNVMLLSGKCALGQKATPNSPYAWWTSARRRRGTPLRHVPSAVLLFTFSSSIIIMLGHVHQWRTQYRLGHPKRRFWSALSSKRTLIFYIFLFFTQNSPPWILSSI